MDHGQVTSHPIVKRCFDAINGLAGDSAHCRNVLRRLGTEHYLLSLACCVGPSASVGEFTPSYGRENQFTICTSTGWTSATELRTQEGAWAYVEAPQVVESRHAAFLIGTPTILSVATGDSVRYTVGGFGQQAAGLILERQGIVRSVPLPPSARNFTRPLATADGRSGMHVVWATQSNASATQWQVDTLWYGRFDGQRWSSPQVVAHDLPVGLNAVGQSALLSQGSNLYFAVPGRRSGSHAAVFVFVRAGSAWRTSAFPVDGPGAAYVAMGMAGATLVLAYAAADAGQAANDRNSVFVRTSRDQGATWSPPQTVYRAGSAGAYDLHVLIASDSTVYLVWAQRRPSGEMTELVAVRASTNNGATWRSEPDIDLRVAFDSFRAVLGSRGRGISWLVRADAMVLQGGLHDSVRPLALPVGTQFPPSLARLSSGSLVALVGQFHYRGPQRIPVTAFVCRAG